MTNWRPTAQGVMTRRPPTRYVDTMRDSTSKAVIFPFVFSTTQSYIVTADDSFFRFYIKDSLLTIPSVTTEIEEGEFDTLHPDLADGSSITASSTSAGSVANLVDESTSSYWQAGGSATATLDFDMTSAVTLRDLWISSPSSPTNRTPTAFTFAGSSTGAFAGEETTILSVTGESNWSASELRRFRITTPGSYRYYRLTMTACEAGTGSYAISEISLYDSPWFDNSTGNGVITITAGKLYIDSDGGGFGIAEQVLPINEASTDHTLVFDVVHGPVNLRIGSTSGGDDLALFETLRTGHHRISFNPGLAANAYIQFYHSANAGRVIDGVRILKAGAVGEATGLPWLTRAVADDAALQVPHPYSETELPEIQWHQIGDVLYLAHPNHETRRLERRGHTSWSLTRSRTEGGPFQDANTGPISLSGSDTSGEITLTASDDLFVDSDAGQLIALTDGGQLKTKTATAVAISTDGIKVTGSSGAARTFNIQVSGTFSGTVRLQESSGNENNYVDTSQTYTAATNVNYDDNKDNQTWFYRLTVEAYTSGSITMKLTYSGGSSTGIVRIVSVTNATSATAEVITPLASTDAVTTWKRQEWSDTLGWPSAITGGYGRFWYSRGIQVWASQSDDFTNFEEGDEDDEAFSWTLNQESSEGIRFLDFIGQLVIGTATREQIGTGNTRSEPVSPTNFQTLPASEEGSAPLKPVRAEGSIIYAHRSRKKLMQFTQTPGALSDSSFTSIDLSELAPELLDDKIVSIAIQREPQRRIFVVLKSGRMGELLFRREIEVTAWNIYETDGRVEDVQVISQEDEDLVYMIVRRKINGQWKRFIERLGREDVAEDWGLFHLDAYLSRAMTVPDTLIEPSGTTGTITVEADDPVFVSGDVGSILWFPVGRGEITAVTDAYNVTVQVRSDLDEARPIPSGRWGFATETSSVSGANHLEGATVRICGDMMDLGTATVSGGAVTLPQACSIVHIGLPVRSRYKSLKLAYGAQKGTAIGQQKAIKQLVALLYRTGPTLTYGRNFDELYSIDTRTDDVPWDEPVPLETSEKVLDFDPEMRTDPRLCFEVDDPLPATVVGTVAAIQTHDR